MSEHCRFCKHTLDWSLIDLGETPLANNYLPVDTPKNHKTAAYPLHVKVCPSCLLAQTTENVDPAVIFAPDYAYYSSFSTSWLEHVENYANHMIQRIGLNEHSRVIEVASNDGYLLQYFHKNNIPVLGIEPAEDTADVAISRGIPTEKKFFGEQLARELLGQGVTADLMPANNVLAHVPNLNDFIKGFKILLKKNGIATFEFPHLLNLINKIQFDTIYHEHYSYLSLMAIERMFKSVGLRVFDLEQLSTHGGSLRIYVCHQESNFELTENVLSVRQQETDAGLDTVEGYKSYSNKVDVIKASFKNYLNRCKNENKKIAAYGAAAKGNTFLNVCSATSEDVECVFDRNTAKQGKLLPGSLIPVYSTNAVKEVRPDIIIILPWNLEKEIREQLEYVKDWGGKFVIFVPDTIEFKA